MIIIHQVRWLLPVKSPNYVIAEASFNPLLNLSFKPNPDENRPLISIILINGEHRRPRAAPPPPPGFSSPNLRGGGGEQALGKPFGQETSAPPPPRPRPERNWSRTRTPMIVNLILFILWIATLCNHELNKLWITILLDSERTCMTIRLILFKYLSISNNNSISDPVLS